jgi:hypothetical protein
LVEDFQAFFQVHSDLGVLANNPVLCPELTNRSR